MYQALYRKWRPRTFDDVVGQGHITQTLKRQVAAGRLSHAYLFTGTRGTGKTTCAKILARAVNCEHAADGDPCNECPSCRGIENGSILDVLELDAASNNRVDDVRALLEEAVYTPAAVRKRVYIVDEAHMITAQAFNALLQILEEPPEHLMFILATTEVHKIPATIKSRCQQFSFKRLRAEDIAGRLDYVARQEGLELTAEGAALIARLANGGMRDALSLLDQCAGAHSAIGEEEILSTLGLAGNLEAAGLLEAAARGDMDDALGRLGRLYDGGKEIAALLGELSALARDLLIRRTAPKAGASLMTGGYDTGTLDRLDALLDTPRLMQMLGALQRCAGDLPRSPDRRTDAELCLVTLCDPTLDGSAAGLSARIAALEERVRSGVPAPAGSPAPPPKAARAARRTQTEERPPLEEPPEGPDYTDEPPPWAWEEPPAPAPKRQPPDRPPAPTAKRQQPPEQPPAAQTGQVPSAGLDWRSLRARLETVMNIADFSFVGNEDMVTGRIEGDTVVLWVETEFIKGFVDRPDILDLIARTGGELLGRPCHAQVRVGEAPPAPSAPAAPPPAAVPAGEPDELDELLGLENVTVT